MNYPKYTVVILSTKNKHISQAPDVLLLRILPHGPPIKGKPPCQKTCNGSKMPHLSQYYSTIVIRAKMLSYLISWTAFKTNVP